MLVRNLKRAPSAQDMMDYRKFARPFRQGRAGFTLVELVMAIVILGAVSLMFIPFYQSIAHSPDPVIRQRAIAMGQGLMDEIMAKRWDENTLMGGGPVITGETPAASGTVCTSTPYSCTGNRLYCFVCRNPDYTPDAASSLGADTGENRIDYDDVDDYHNLNENGTFSDQNGNSFTLAGYSRQVAVRYIASNASPIDRNTPAAGSTTDTKLVVVTVTTPTNETLYLVSVVCNI